MILYNTSLPCGYVLAMDGFESEHGAIDESRLRYKKLYEDGSDESKYLADKLWDCCERNIRCNSAACKICSRILRLYLVETLVQNVGIKADEYSLVTVIFYDSVVGDCRDINLVSLKERLRKMITRSGIKNAVIGAFEMDYEPKEKQWYPHFHLLMPKSNDLKLFKERFKKNQRSAPSRNGKRKIPLKEDNLNNPVEQISYIFKYMWQQLPWSNQGGKRRLSNEQFCSYLVFVNEQGHRRLMFLYKARLEGGLLKLKSP